MARETLQLIQDTVDGQTVLRAPGVGTLTAALDRGRLVRAGDEAGVLETLGLARVLIVPEGIVGRIENSRPERVHHPVAHGDVLFKLSALEAGEERAATTSDTATGGGPILRAPYSGRFWHRSAPGEAPFASIGDRIEAGATIGLLEVMKTFTHLSYPSDGSLPSPARIVRMLIPDGGEIRKGDPVIEVESV